VDGAVRTRHLSGALVNREQIDWVVPATDDAVTMPDVAFDSNIGPLVKDFTGDLVATPAEAPDEAAE
jgi:hypothetical protein